MRLFSTKRGAVSMKFAYDDVTDSILIFVKKPDEQVKGSATIGNLVLDFAKDGKLVGLEIRKATDFFKAMSMGKDPSEIEDAKLAVTYKRDGFMLIVWLKFTDQEEQKLPIFVSSESPQLATA